jgi:hypothetical protein
MHRSGFIVVSIVFDFRRQFRLFVVAMNRNGFATR